MSNKEEKNEITLAELAAEMRSGFQEIGGQFVGLENRFTGLEDKVTKLGTYTQQGFETMMGAIDAVDKKTENMLTKTGLDIRLEKLGAGLFTTDEKESIMATVELVNKQLEASVVGKESISLTRSEYDTLIDAVHLPNRFSKRETVEVD